MDNEQERRLENEIAKQNRNLALIQAIFTIVGVIVGVVVTVGQPLYNLAVNQKLHDARIAVLEAKVQQFEKSKDDLTKQTGEILIKVVRIEGKLYSDKD